MARALLIGKHHPLLRKIRLIASQARRAPADLVVAEGIRTLEEATRAPRVIETVLVSENFGFHAREKSLLIAWQERDIKPLRLPERLLQTVSDLVTCQGAVALVHVPARGLAEVDPGQLPLLVCACGIQDPGNLGTMIRTALAAGASMVCTSPGTVSAKNPKAIRSSAGAFFHIPVVEHIAPAEIVAYCKAHGIRMYRAAPHAGLLYPQVDFRPPSALLFGSEARGVSGKQWPGTPSVGIPMAAGVESLNVAAAAAVLLFEVFRQRSAPYRA